MSEQKMSQQQKASEQKACFKSCFIRRCRKPATLGGGYKAIVKCDKFCYTHLTIFNVLHSTVKLRLNCEYAVT